VVGLILMMSQKYLEEIEVNLNLGIVEMFGIIMTLIMCGALAAPTTTTSYGDVGSKLQDTSGARC
jgi:hypothetical protein